MNDTTKPGPSALSSSADILEGIRSDLDAIANRARDAMHDDPKAFAELAELHSNAALNLASIAADLRRWANRL